jgi:hypothetical protein
VTVLRDGGVFQAPVPGPPDRLVEEMFGPIGHEIDRTNLGDGATPASRSTMSTPTAGRHHVRDLPGEVVSHRWHRLRTEGSVLAGALAPSRRTYVGSGRRLHPSRRSRHIAFLPSDRKHRSCSSTSRRQNLLLGRLAVPAPVSRTATGSSPARLMTDANVKSDSPEAACTLSVATSEGDHRPLARPRLAVPCSTSRRRHRRR